MNLPDNFFQSYVIMNNPRTKRALLAGHAIVHPVTLPHVTFLVFIVLFFGLDIATMLKLKSKYTSFVNIYSSLPLMLLLIARACLQTRLFYLFQQ